MLFNKQNFIPLGRLAIRFNLPKRYLKELAGKKLIPSLDINGRLRFNPAAVQQALDKLAAEGCSDDR